MVKKFLLSVAIVNIGLALCLAACGSAPGASPVGAVETYVQALVARDGAALVNAACASWEAAAREELESFAAVSVTLQDMQCRSTGQSGDINLVSCTGKILANYGNEVLEINLADRSFQVVQEAGEWRVCGYR